MKYFSCLLLLGLLLAESHAAVLSRHAGAAKERMSDDRTITKVVKMLQDMMTKSQADGDNERTLFGKFKCYCDDNEAEKTASIRMLTQQIAMLESAIEGLQAENGKLSKEVAGLKAGIEEAKQAMAEATTLRQEANAAYVALVDDLTQAISQMTDAIDTLAAVGADQTLQSARDHEKFMAGYDTSLLKLKSRIQEAMTAAKAFLPADKQSMADSFLQAPFTGNYAAQSGEIVGILKNMRDTFTSNLNAAHKKEEKELAAYNEFMAAKDAEVKKMEGAYSKKQGELASNDAELTAKKQQLKDAKQSKAEDEAFLAELLPMCAKKASEYQDRLALRKQEEAAIAEAISILNSDAAFATFGKVDATSTGDVLPDFLQMGSKRRHSVSGKRLQAEQLLRRAAKGSAHLDKAVQMLKDGNPFDVVLAEMRKMLDLITKEEADDVAKRDWCVEERKRTNADIEEKNQEILGLEEDIQDLTDVIHMPVEGLLAQIEADEKSLAENLDSQKKETEIRTEENKEYQEDIAHLVESQGLVKRAIVVLKAYYKKVLGELEASFVQESPDPPKTWEGQYAGQSTAGNTVIEMLDYILSEAAKEEKTAHADEEAAQKAYEDSMQALKDQEAALEENLSQLRETLASTQKVLQEKKDDLKGTTAARDALEAYLLQIKPGCDFIVANIEARQGFRQSETTALNEAIKLIEGSPVYQTAVEDARIAALGDCKDLCLPAGHEVHVECKACLADVTIPGYCAGHPDTMGCDAVSF